MSCAVIKKHIDKICTHTNPCKIFLLFLAKQKNAEKITYKKDLMIMAMIVRRDKRPVFVNRDTVKIIILTLDKPIRVRFL